MQHPLPKFLANNPPLLFQLVFRSEGGTNLTPVPLWVKYQYTRNQGNISFAPPLHTYVATLLVVFFFPFYAVVCYLNHRVHTTDRVSTPLSGVHPIMMEKSALAGEGGGCKPTPFTIFTIKYKVAVYAPAERADTVPPSISSLPDNVLCVPSSHFCSPTLVTPRFSTAPIHV